VTPEQFIAKWQASTLKERSAAQSHFLDLCEMLGVSKPTDVDPKGEWYCFERGASKTAGGEGWADVWMRGHFGWEYKGKRKDLRSAYAQLQQYAVALENPPLLVACDMDQFVIHTNWTNTVPETHVIRTDELVDSNKRDILRAVFTNPDILKPSRTIDAVTLEAANAFAALAISLRERGHDAQEVAHFVNRLVFCMFAEDINLLPRRIFNQILDQGVKRPELVKTMLEQLFAAMKSGGLFGVDEIEWFNGGLFDDNSSLPLVPNDLKVIRDASTLNWSDIDPSIFGTLFERGLDPAKRSQLGAHYTNPEKIMMIVEPVVIKPLLHEWEQIKTQLQKARVSAKRKASLFNGFLERLRTFRVLDPACGSGNFLYLALLSLKDLEHRVSLEGEALGLGRQFPTVGPEAVMGIELNPYAAELARVTVWIGEIQWMRKNGFDVGKRPILKPLKNIDCTDALLNEERTEQVWPEADVIIGNPPFLGGRKLKPELGEDYVEQLRRVYGARLPDGADLVCFWFDKANKQIVDGKAKRAGLVATNSISGGSNRDVLSAISKANQLYEVWADEPWTVEGASVRVALICFGLRDAGDDVRLDGKPVDAIFPDLTAKVGESGADLSGVVALDENKSVAFQGVVPRGEVNRKDKEAKNLPDASFLIAGALAREMLALPTNPNGRRNADVVRPYWIGDEITTRPLDRFIVDFNDMTEEAASLYEAPFAYIAPVKLHRAAMNQPEALQLWWRHWNTRPKMRAALSKAQRYIATPRVAKHRLFVWLPASVLPDCQIVAIARSDDTTFGILHSRFHEIWTLRMCTYLGVGNDPRYTPSTTFETFPFPDGMAPNISSDRFASNDRAVKIAQCAERLSQLRQNWLYPPELVELVQDAVPQFPPRIVPVDEKAATELKKRTLTNLYNTRPSWLANAHSELDAAVAEAYGWPVGISDGDAIRALITLNRSRGTLL
jgi:type II restriction/modification system DNA methylase subunit YeeA